MKTRSNFLSIMLIVCFYALVPAARAQRIAKITVGPNVHVSTAREKTPHDEALIAADPSDPSRRGTKAGLI